MLLLPNRMERGRADPEDAARGHIDLGVGFMEQALREATRGTEQIPGMLPG